MLIGEKDPRFPRAARNRKTRCLIPHQTRREIVHAQQRSPLLESQQPPSETRIHVAMTTTPHLASSRTASCSTRRPMNRTTQQAGAISAGAICCLLSLAIVLPSAVLLLMLHFTPLVVTSTGDAGTFESVVSSKDL